MPHSVIQQVHLLGLKDKMPLLNRQSLVFERRPGIPLPDTELEKEGLDLIEYGDDGDDDDLIPKEDESDIPLVHDNIISINEIIDIQGPPPDDHLASDSDSESDESFHSTDSDVDSDDDSSQYGDDTQNEDQLSEIKSQINDASTTDFVGDPRAVNEPVATTASRANDEETEGATLDLPVESSTEREEEPSIDLDVRTNAGESGASANKTGANPNVSIASKGTNMVKVPSVASPSEHGYNLRNRDDLRNRTTFND